MFLLDLIFGKHKKEAAAPLAPVCVVPAASKPTAPGTSIQYHPELIGQFENDHRELLRLFTEIRASVLAGDLPATSGYLDEFRHMLHGHLLKENVRLYIYLEHALANDTVSHDLMHRFRHEMDAIGKVVVAFLEKYRHLAEQPELADAFAQELDGIGKVLVERIRSEEVSLYPLYGPV
ncbi:MULTISPECIES: hemerythrin domain-containing protein [Zoogloea]|jgi:hypothetical protein|uniref:Hemerythrin domain-containing protein n=1 Tax=Zoogloea oleivorans TaxID=1552750 RepID=A0A6C2CSI2_9RHOO|nr:MULTISPECIES: hemerythrin domain-containing protein [Zoogloea]MBT9499239.1 hemerythrin domain-containing protein [Zoogloea sp.]MDD2669676.1 hemerythrin domain-containing protein [Zoogloea sp.]MDY0036079.1 hemerythrin domain-containing protein [Zoogloea oleivorans]TYC56603.1 hemerythrin domain-containing protein [Zoogloea oleivorans]